MVPVQPCSTDDLYHLIGPHQSEMTQAQEGLWAFALADFPFTRTPVLHGAASLYDSDQNRNYGENQQDVDKSAQGVRADHSEQPQNQQQNCNCPEHLKSSPVR